MSIQRADERSRLEEVCAHVLGLVGQRAEAEVTATRTRLGLTRFANSGVHQHVSEDVVDVRLRVAVDGRVAAVETTRVDPTGLGELVERGLAAASVRPVDPEWPGLAPPVDIPPVDHYDPDTARTLPRDRVAHVHGFVIAGEDLSAAGFVESAAHLTAFANSAGQRAFGRATRATVDGIQQTATSAGKGHQTTQRLAELDGAAAGATAARLATDSVEAGELPPDTYEVVLSPECVGTILVFLAAYGFNAKSHIEGQSFAELGGKQFDSAITLWDDATDARAIGMGFDAEGTPKRPVTLIEAGTTSALAHDRRTAARSATVSTGHAIPGGESWGAFPGNLFMAGGDATFEELVGQMRRGLVVTEFNYCRILDPKTQVVTGLTRNGTFLVENGRVVRPVANLRFTQSFVDALAPGQVRGVTAAARFADAEFGTGLVHAPAAHLAEWRFTGGPRG